MIAGTKCWNRRSTLEKKLTILIIIAVCASIGLIITLASIIFKTELNEDNLYVISAEALNGQVNSNKNITFLNDVTDGKDVCLNPSCIHTASKILNAMDTDVAPCEDFYQFSCGNFLKKTIIPDHKTSINEFDKVTDQLQEQLKILMSEDSKQNESRAFIIAKNLYKACMNKTVIEERGITPVMAILKKLGGWPVVVGKSWNERSWTWEQATKDFAKLGYSVNNIMEFSIEADSKNSSRRIIYLDQTYPGLSREFLVKGFDDVIIQAYYSYMVDIAVIYGANRDVAEKELKETLLFQIALANISRPKEERRDENELYNPMTIHETQEKYTYVDWQNYINSILPVNVRVDMNEIIIIKEPKYFQELGKLLLNTPKRTIANYMMWLIAHSSSYYLTDELRKRQHKFENVLNGKQEQEPRWKECIDVTTTNLQISVGAMYVRKHFKENSKHEIVEMVNRIQIEFENILNNLEWMDNNTKKVALRKIKGMKAHIGYPDELLDDKKLEEYYQNLEVDSDKYLESYLKITIFQTNYKLNQFRKPVNKTDWVDHAIPAFVNAFYSPNENSIQFFAAILQGQFFSVDRPKYMNYGSIGAIIGHEITHGFDDQGRQFDENGDLVDWWETDTKAAYLKKAQCMVDQYGNFTDEISGLNLNGINTQGENIADNGGVKEAYYAYKKWVEENGPEPKLPGLNYTPEQMFWISYAQIWCTVNRPEQLKLAITLDEHSPEEFRIIGPLTNNINFSTDFQCTKGTPMNPNKKCVVW